jgi:predicted negative regulator of RcsB-dependent stress response
MLKDKRLPLVLGAIAALGGLIAFVKYFEDKEHREVQKRVTKLEEAIKREQLKKIQNERT